MYKRPSLDPTNTLSSHTTGELFTCPRVAKVQTTSPLSRRRQCRRLSCPPKSTRSLVTPARKNTGRADPCSSTQSYRPSGRCREIHCRDAPHTRGPHLPPHCHDVGIGINHFFTFALGNIDHMQQRIATAKHRAAIRQCRRTIDVILRFIFPNLLARFGIQTVEEKIVTPHQHIGLLAVG